MVPLVVGLGSTNSALVLGDWVSAVVAAVCLALTGAIWWGGGGTFGEMRGVLRWLALFPALVGVQVSIAAVLWRSWGGLAVAIGAFAIAAVIWRVFGGAWPGAGRTRPT